MLSKLEHAARRARKKESAQPAVEIKISVLK